MITQQQKVFLPAYWVRSNSYQGSFVIERLMRGTRTGCNARRFKQQSSCRQILQKGELHYSVYSKSGSNIGQRSISAWCIVFMLGVALQVGATDNVAYIYCESNAYSTNIDSIILSLSSWSLVCWYGHWWTFCRCSYVQCRACPGDHQRYSGGFTTSSNLL